MRRSAAEEYPVGLVSELGEIDFGDGARREAALARASVPVHCCARADERLQREVLAAAAECAALGDAAPLHVVRGHGRYGWPIGQRVGNTPKIADRLPADPQ